MINQHLMHFFYIFFQKKIKMKNIDNEKQTNVHNMGKKKTFVSLLLFFQAYFKLIWG